MCTVDNIRHAVYSTLPPKPGNSSSHGGRSSKAPYSLHKHSLNRQHSLEGTSDPACSASAALLSDACAEALRSTNDPDMNSSDAPPKPVRLPRDLG